MNVRPWVWALLLLPAHAFAAETDQYLSWGVELKDSSAAINRFLNSEVQAYLEKVSARETKPRTREELVNNLYLYLFRGIHSSRLRNWLHHSSEVERYPDRSVPWFRYQQESVYWAPSFPYILPMSRTIRVGDVYCGIDKFSHFFGFGRRFFLHYHRLRAQGLEHEAAMERMIRAGIAWENGVVGKLVDGIFSHADLEAVFQGFRLAYDLCDEGKAYLARDGEEWTLARPINILEYVTPDFDESYNPCHYWALRKRFALPLLKEKYGPRIKDPAVQARFARYREYTPSFSKRTIEKYFDAKGKNPQKEQYYAAFGVPPGCGSEVLASAP
ncbi:MAG: hypothetical protein HY706_12475 [Candidatus Hydrogenedentes bacterium]|nr:hypothetical protein [Candidatus Hydrogenedentota bacterium]